MCIYFSSLCWWSCLPCLWICIACSTLNCCIALSFRILIGWFVIHLQEKCQLIKLRLTHTWLLNMGYTIFLIELQTGFESLQQLVKKCEGGGICLYENCGGCKIRVYVILFGCIKLNVIYDLPLIQTFPGISCMYAQILGGRWYDVCLEGRIIFHFWNQR